MTTESGEVTRRCPKCGRPMKLIHSIPAVNGLPPLGTFRCCVCSEISTERIDHHQEQQRELA